MEPDRLLSGRPALLLRPTEQGCIAYTVLLCKPETNTCSELSRESSLFLFLFCAGPIAHTPTDKYSILIQILLKIPIPKL